MNGDIRATLARAAAASQAWLTQHPRDAVVIAVAAALACAVAAWPSRSHPAPRPLTASAFASADALAEALSGETVWRALELRFPGATRQAADAAWAARQRGADDREMMGAARQVQHGLVTTALATAPDPLLDQHAELTRRTLAAASEAGPLVCSAALDGSLDLAAVLPPAVVKADETFKVLLASTPPRRGKPLSHGAVYRALQPVLLAVTPAQAAVLVSPDDRRLAGRTRCDAFTAFYGAIGRLPAEQRRLALRAALQR